MCALGCAATGAEALDCGDFGMCEDETGARLCVCDEGWSGATCEACADGYALMEGVCEPELSVTEGLRLWYDAASADDVAVNAEGEVTSITNRASGTYTLASLAGSRPTLAEDGIGGRPALVFDAEDEVLAALVTNTDALAGEDYTIFVVAAPMGLTAQRGLLAYGTGTNFGFLLETATSGYRAVHRSPVGTTGGDDVQTTRPAANPHLIRVARNGSGGLTVLQMNVADGTDFLANTDTQVLSTAATGGSHRFRIGDASGLSFRGQIAEVLVFDRTLDGPDSTAVSTYLHRKWFR